MRRTPTSRHGTFMVMVLGALSLAAATATAQPGFEPLFDRLNIKLEGSWVALNTEVRVDSKQSGRGTTLTFEDDLDLDSSKAIPSLALEWQISNRHRLGVRWQDINRDSSAQALTEFRWGDQVVPVDAAVSLGFDVTQYAIDWTFYPWVRERWAAGFGLGVRVVEIWATLTWQEQISGSGGAESSSITGPLPYVNLEYRRLLGEQWRLTAGVGWLDVKIQDIQGTQWIAHASIEYLLGRRWALGGSFNLATIDANAESADFIGSVAFDVNDVSLFARVRF